MEKSGGQVDGIRRGREKINYSKGMKRKWYGIYSVGVKFPADRFATSVSHVFNKRVFF
jgi:hypothetical protein